jgi:hypothetical protein
MYEMSELQHLNKTISLEGMGAGQTWGGGGVRGDKRDKKYNKASGPKANFSHLA